MTAAERQQRHRLGLTSFRDTEPVTKREADVAALKARIAELEAEVAKAADTQQQRSSERPRTAADLMARKAQVRAARKAKQAEAKAARLAAAAAERPDADMPTLLAENDDLKRKLNAAQTRIRNISGELRHIRQWHEQEMAKTGRMSFATHVAIAKVLHPDRRKQASEADIDEAYKQFNAWKADKDKARRR
jgi:hypothetical protein